MALLLAAVFTGLCRPLYAKLLAWLRGRRSAASLATLVLVLIVVVVPLIGFMGIVASQALEVSETVKPWVAERVAEQDSGEKLLAGVELPGFLQPYHSQIVSKLGALAEGAGSFLVAELAQATRGTASFLFLLFVMLYAMFFFLRDGEAILVRMLAYSPLRGEEEDRLLERFVSVARATLKGTLVIAIVQGGLAGLAFAVAGIKGAAFWGTLMALLSIIPGIGTALVWVPAAIYLFATGKTVAGVGLTLWCTLAVGTVDNLLRPRLVGRDTQMSDLLIFLSTLGGILAFGAVGLLIGPLVAALFVTVWDLYGIAFQDFLPQRSPASPGEDGGSA
jgi:predicted PurR-regulated permease PerM